MIDSCMSHSANFAWDFNLQWNNEILHIDFEKYKIYENVFLTISKILLNNSNNEQFAVVNATPEGSFVGAEVFIYSKKWLSLKWVAMRKKSTNFKNFNRFGFLIYKDNSEKKARAIWRFFEFLVYTSVYPWY